MAYFATMLKRMLHQVAGEDLGSPPTLQPVCVWYTHDELLFRTRPQGLLDVAKETWEE